MKKAKKFMGKMKGMFVLVLALSMAVSAVPAQAAKKSTPKKKANEYIWVSPKSGQKNEECHIKVTGAACSNYSIHIGQTDQCKGGPDGKTKIIKSTLNVTPFYLETKLWGRKPITVKDVTKKATYKSSNKKVVSVEGKGVFLARKAGKATITVKYKNMTKKIKVTVSGHKWKKISKQYTKMEKHMYCSVCGEDLYPAGSVYCHEHGWEFCMCRPNEHLQAHRDKGEFDEDGLINAPLTTKKVVVWEVYRLRCSCGIMKKPEGEAEWHFSKDRKKK